LHPSIVMARLREPIPKMLTRGFRAHPNRLKGDAIPIKAFYSFLTDKKRGGDIPPTKGGGTGILRGQVKNIKIKEPQGPKCLAVLLYSTAIRPLFAQLLLAADKALYQAKSGRSHSWIFHAAILQIACGSFRVSPHKRAGKFSSAAGGVFGCAVSKFGWPPFPTHPGGCGWW
jgi:hypothetical protein